VLQADRRLAAHVQVLASRRMVFFAGIPGTGKSLLVHQLAHLARDAGRTVHLLQWDVARPVFEASPGAQRYPIVDGVTHPLIRKAAGLWVRQAIVAWNERHPEPQYLLVGETPFVGGRFVELARVIDDRAETLLTAPSCRFAVAVPSREVRRFLETERERRAERPMHSREREDAPPRVLRDLWRELAGIAGKLGFGEPGDEYDPVVYRDVYTALLRHRNVDVVPLDVILPTEKLSVYDFAVTPPGLVPTAAEAEAFIAQAIRRYADPAELEREIVRWWEV
jgi:hypothetical protein